jgi:hypothetical protein
VLLVSMIAAAVKLIFKWRVLSRELELVNILLVQQHSQKKKEKEKRGGPILGPSPGFMINTNLPLLRGSHLGAYVLRQVL